MLMLYFSGTGNSRYVATLFCQKVGAICHSIEETIDFASLINNHDTIAFCYPIYGGCVPRIMREFVLQHASKLQDKRLVILCTQYLFSGDGACALTRVLKGSREQVIYAEHFNMPNNICNIKIFSVKNGKQCNRYLKVAEKKMDVLARNLKNNVVRKRGFGVVSSWLGKTQNSGWPSVEQKKKSSVKIDRDCIQCGLCAKICPVKNLSLEDTGIVQHNNCMLCFRCVNACPKQAITVLTHQKPQTQYQGVSFSASEHDQ